MKADELEELRAFLRDYVSTFDELETLLFFLRAPREPWTACEIATATGLDLDRAQLAIEELMTVTCLLERVSQSCKAQTFRFVPPANLESVLIGLQRAYAEQRLRVVQIMSSNAMERVRASAAQRMADVLRLERNKN